MLNLLRILNTCNQSAYKYQPCNKQEDVTKPLVLQELWQVCFNLVNTLLQACHNIVNTL